MDLKMIFWICCFCLFCLIVFITLLSMCKAAGKADEQLDILFQDYERRQTIGKDVLMTNFMFGENKKMENAKKIKIKYFDEEIEKISKIDKGDWIDLRAAEKVVLDKGDFKLIPLGIAMKLPEGYEAHVVPRSSTFKNYGIIQTNHQAVIDESYCGDNDQWFMPVYATRLTTINKGDRICQFRIMKKMPPIEFEEVEKMEDEDRGGIGSTGVN